VCVCVSVSVCECVCVCELLVSGCVYLSLFVSLMIKIYQDPFTPKEPLIPGAVVCIVCIPIYPVSMYVYPSLLGIRFNLCLPIYWVPVSIYVYPSLVVRVFV
jgi:hypothetical protein